MVTIAENCALIIIDLQRDYFDAALWPDSALPEAKDRLVAATNALVARFREAGRPVLWTLQEFKSNMSDGFLRSRNGNRVYCVQDTPGAELLEGLAVQPVDCIIRKKRYSAFFDTELEAHLRDLRVEQIYLAGITTSWCVRSTAVDAYQRDIEVFLCRDCLAGFSEAEHERDLAAMDGMIATVVNASKI